MTAGLNLSIGDDKRTAIEHLTKKEPKIIHYTSSLDVSMVIKRLLWQYEVS